jgi:hypothetical protein
MFNGGGTVEDIYRRLRTGLDGTPMPSYADALAANLVSDDQLWAVSHYVKSLGGETPVVREVVEAVRAETLPAGAADSAWSGAVRYWVPLVGQIIVKPRWFAPAVTGVWVQALHDGSDIAMRVSWTDRSRSPDPIWADWRSRVTTVVEPHEGGAGPAAEADSLAEVPALSDALAVWFPRSPPEGATSPTGAATRSTPPSPTSGTGPSTSPTSSTDSPARRRAATSGPPWRRCGTPPVARSTSSSRCRT